MRHWSELNTIKGWGEKPILIVGSSPALDRIDEIDISNFNVIALNYSVVKLGKCWIWAHADHWEDFYPPDGIEHEAMLTRCINRPFIKEKRKTFILEYKEDTELMNHVMFPGKKMLPRSSTIAGLGLVLVDLGVKEISTVGIDGGYEYSEALRNTPAFNNREDYNLHNSGFYHYLSEAKIKINKLI